MDAAAGPNPDARPRTHTVCIQGPAQLSDWDQQPRPCNHLIPVDMNISASNAGVPSRNAPHWTVPGPKGACATCNSTTAAYNISCRDGETTQPHNSRQNSYPLSDCAPRSPRPRAEFMSMMGRFLQIVGGIRWPVQQKKKNNFVIIPPTRNVKIRPSQSYIFFKYCPSNFAHDPPTTCRIPPIMEERGGARGSTGERGAQYDRKQNPRRPPAPARSRRHNSRCQNQPLCRYVLYMCCACTLQPGHHPMGHPPTEHLQRRPFAWVCSCE